MKLIQGKEAITATMLIVLISCPVWLIVGGIITSKLHHLFGVRNTSWFLIFLGMGVPLGLIIAWSKSRIIKTNAQRMGQPSRRALIPPLMPSEMRKHRGQPVKPLACTLS